MQARTCHKSPHDFEMCTSRYWHQLMTFKGSSPAPAAALSLNGRIFTSSSLHLLLFFDRPHALSSSFFAGCQDTRGRLLSLPTVSSLFRAGMFEGTNRKRCDGVILISAWMPPTCAVQRQNQKVTNAYTQKKSHTMSRRVCS